MTLGEIAGIAEAQRVTRAVVHDVAETAAAGDTERAVRWLECRRAPDP